jgi:GntR family transcriptional regulator
VLVKDTGMPLHTQLYHLLQAQIESGELPPESQLPSERELCERYGVSRTTVRNALAQLINQGLVYTAIGKGSYVAPPRLVDNLQPFHSFTESMRQRGLQASSRLLEARVEDATAEQARRLGIPPAARVIVLERLRLADGAPIVIQRSWLPHHKCPGLLKFDLEARSLFDILRNEYELRLSRAETDLRAALASDDECRLLHVEPPRAGPGQRPVHLR